MNLLLTNIIASLSYAIALCGIVPLFQWLTTTPRLAIMAGMAAGIWQNFRGNWPTKNWAYNAAIVPVFLYYSLQYSRANPIQPVVSVLAIMLAIRLGGEKSGRYYLQIQALSLFCLASSSLFDLSPAFLIYLALMLLMVAVELVLLTFYSQDSSMVLSRADLRRVVAAGLFMPLASLPLLVIFFPILPRTQLPLWNFLSPAIARTSGIADKVEPGSSANIGETPVLAFRAEMPRQPQATLYWRGTVFNKIVGNRWVRDEMMPFERINSTGPQVTQSIYPEPSLSRTLIALDAPTAISLQRIRHTSDNTYILLGSAAKRLSYKAESSTVGILPDVNNFKHDFYLQLPADIPPRIRRLADGIQRQGHSDVRRVELLEQYFRNGNYRYSLHDLPTGDHALEKFLFDKKQGHCEFFASSFALVLRAAGVPARLVGGYLGGDYNEMGGYYLITEDKTHVWVEVFIAGKGRMRIDPSGFAVNAGAIWGGAPKHNLLRKMQLALDSLNHTWNRAIISYDFESQVDAVRRAGKSLKKLDPAIALKIVWPVVTLSAVLIAAFAIIVNRNNLLWPSREERLLRKFYHRLENDCGIKANRNRQGLYELASISNNEKVREFVDMYGGVVYRDRKLSADEYKRLKRKLKGGFDKTFQ